MCDKSRDAIKFVINNVKKTNLEENAIIINKDYKQCLNDVKKDEVKFDIIFLDPPYDLDISKEAVKIILEYKLLNENGIIIIETDEKERELRNLKTMNVEIYDSRKYGRANLIFLAERG